MNVLWTASIPTLLPDGFRLKVMHLPSLYTGSQGLLGDLCVSQAGLDSSWSMDYGSPVPTFQER